MRDDMHLSDDGYLRALLRMGARIAAGLPLTGFDCTAVGAKDTQCSWGLCSDSLEQWPDDEDHLFPERLPHRSSPKYRQAHQRCPMQADDGEPLGCFYRCRFFQSQHPTPTKDEALALYEAAIDRATETADAR